MLYKYINEHRIERVTKNGFINVDDKRVGISNLPKYLEDHPDIAKANGYYNLVEGMKPECDVETQFLACEYTLEDGMIYEFYTVENIPAGAEEASL